MVAVCEVGDKLGAQRVGARRSRSCKVGLVRSLPSPTSVRRVARVSTAVRSRAVPATGGGVRVAPKATAVDPGRPIVQGRATTCQKDSTQASTQDRCVRRNPRA